MSNKSIIYCDDCRQETPCKHVGSINRSIEIPHRVRVIPNIATPKAGDRYTNSKGQEFIWLEGRKEETATLPVKRYFISLEVKDQDGKLCGSATREIPIGFLNINAPESFWTQLADSLAKWNVDILTTGWGVVQDSLRKSLAGGPRP